MSDYSSIMSNEKYASYSRVNEKYGRFTSVYQLVYSAEDIFTSMTI